MKKSILTLTSILSLALALPSTSKAALKFTPAGRALVYTAQGALILIPSLAQAGNKKGTKNTPRDSNSSNGKGDRGVGSRYQDPNPGTSRGRSESYEGNGNGSRNSPSGGSARYGMGGDGVGYSGLYKTSLTAAALSALVLSVDPQALPPVLLKDHLESYLKPELRVAMPIKTPEDLKKLWENVLTQLDKAGTNLNEVQELTSEAREELNQYLSANGLDLNNPENEVVGFITINPGTIAAVSASAETEVGLGAFMSEYLKSLIYTN